MTDVNHEPGPSTTQSAASIAATASGGAGGSAGMRRIRTDGAVCRGDGYLPARRPRRDPPPSPATSASISSGTDAIGSTRPRAPSSRPTQSSPRPGRPSSSHSATIRRFPTAWWSIGRRWSEAVLQDVAPLPTPLGVVAERRERHPQVPGRQDTHLLAQPAGRPAVVGDGDDRRQAVRHQAQRREARRQPVPTAERDDRRAVPAPGRPRRRRRSFSAQVPMRDDDPAALSPAAGSATPRRMATERCLPPVQPDRDRHVALVLVT